ncbi:MAG: mannonate dehydratase [Spirosomataceae bacterium]
MRWFGPKDPVSLLDLRQSGCEGVVTALHDIPVGDVWSYEAIQERKHIIEQDNHQLTPLAWMVVESLPVHEDIKKGKPSRDHFIQNYRTSLQNLAASGIDTVCYNFMPVLDWSRTHLAYPMPDGARALRFVWVDFAVFDLFILQRPHAAKDYTSEVLELAKARFDGMSQEEKRNLTDTILLGLPGSEEAFSLHSFQSLLDEYHEISAEKLRENLHYFIQSVAPLAEELGMKLCIHPDDPPFPLLGLPRVVSTRQDLLRLWEACPVSANGITFCTGSLGVRADQDLVDMVKEMGDRIHFLHLRATKREQESPLIFHEARHLEGDVNMVALIREVLIWEKKTGRSIPMRPDHGHQMMDDLAKKTYPGYSAIGRMKGLAELRGIETALSYMLNN